MTNNASGRGNTKDYRWPRMACPNCRRDVAYSVDRNDPAMIWLRRHVVSPGRPCPFRRIWAPPDA